MESVNRRKKITNSVSSNSIVAEEVNQSQGRGPTKTNKKKKLSSETPHVKGHSLDFESDSDVEEFSPSPSEVLQKFPDDVCPLRTKVNKKSKPQKNPPKAQPLLLQESNLSIPNSIKRLVNQLHPVESTEEVVEKEILHTDKFFIDPSLSRTDTKEFSFAPKNKSNKLPTSVSEATIAESQDEEYSFTPKHWNYKSKNLSKNSDSEGTIAESQIQGQESFTVKPVTNKFKKHHKKSVSEEKIAESQSHVKPVNNKTKKFQKHSELSEETVAEAEGQESFKLHLKPVNNKSKKVTKSMKKSPNFPNSSESDSDESSKQSTVSSINFSTNSSAVVSESEGYASTSKYKPLKTEDKIKQRTGAQSLKFSSTLTSLAASKKGVSPVNRLRMKYKALKAITRKPQNPSRSPRVRHYKHFIETTHIYEKGFGSSHSSDSLISGSSGSHEYEHKPDMTWILEEEHSSDEEAPVIPVRKTLVTTNPDETVDQDMLFTTNKFYNAFSLMLRTLHYLGRMPFDIYVNKETGILECKKYKGVWKLLFVLSTFVFLLALVAGGLSAGAIIFALSRAKDHYTNFEKLLLQKHWLHMTNFLCMLLICVVGSFSMMTSGQQMVDYINQWGGALQILNYDASSGIRKIGYANLILTAIDILIWYPVVYTHTLGLHESNKFITILLFRWVIPHQDAWDSLQISILQHFVLFFQIYLLFATRSMVGFVLVFCRGIVNVAHLWNLRIALLLRKLIPTTKDLIILKQSLTYKKVLEDHLVIVRLVRKLSDSFAAIFVIFFAVQILVVTCELFKVATIVIFDLKIKNINSTVVGNSDVKYNTTPQEEGFEIIFFMFSTLFMLGGFSLYSSAVGETVMNGFDAVRRHGLMLAKNVKERKFIMSLTMSFNSTNPYVLTPGNFFKIDRSVLLGVIAGSLMIFSIMIQCKIVNLVQVSIILPCRNEIGEQQTLCLKSDTENLEPGESSFKPIIFPPTEPPPEISTKGTTEKRTTEEKTTTTTTITTTTTPKPPPGDCENAPPRPPSDPNQWVKLYESLEEKIKKCGTYCGTTPYGDKNPTPRSTTRVYRMVPRRKDATEYPGIKDSWGKAGDDTKNCVLEPYKKILDGTEVYDCFGICYKVRDDCGHYAFSLFNPPLKKRNVKDKRAAAGFDGECFTETKKNQEEFQPQEICGLPFEVVKYVCGRPQELHRAFTDEDKIWDPFFGTGLAARCDVDNYNPEKKPDDKELVYKWNQVLSGPKGYTIRKLKAFTYVSDIKGTPLPMRLLEAKGKKIYYNASKFFDVFPYSYMDPRLLPRATNPPPKTTDKLMSYGLYDCFGNSLYEFDDCGGLPFSIVFTHNGTNKIRTPDLVKVALPLKKKEYNCYESPWSKVSKYYTKCEIPADISPISAMEKFIYDKCEGWKNMLNL